MTVKPGVDLGAAFEVLKSGLNRYDQEVKKRTLESGYIAGGELAGMVEAVITYCTEGDGKETVATAATDDIPAELFTNVKTE